MGVFTRITKAGSLANQALPASVGITSPYASDSLTRVVYQDYFQGELGDVTRGSAMQVPAIARARGILSGVIAPLALKQLEGETELDTPWLYRTSGQISPWHRMAWTIDDLLFYGWSLWAVDRDGSGSITDAVRVDYARWEFDGTTGEIRVDGKAVPANEVILIPGPFEGVLLAGAPTITGARALDRAWIARAQNPIPLIHAHPESVDDVLDDDELDAIAADLNNVLGKPKGALVTDGKWRLEAFGTAKADMFEGARNASVLDVARLTGIPASLLDGSMSTASLTYSTQDGKRNEFLDFSLQYWTAPVEARLSMDDVCPPGQRIRFDKTQLTVTEAAPIAAPTED